MGGSMHGKEGTAPDADAGPRGVGVAYHPFLHDALLAARGAYDFVEFPLDRYLDEAQRALLDPDLARVKALAAVKPCTWRGGSLTYASGGGAAASPDRIAALIRASGAVLVREDLSGAGRDAPALPGTDLGAPRIPALPLAALARPAAALTRGGRGLGVDISPADLSADPGPMVGALARLPDGCALHLAVDAEEGRVWPLLDAVLAARAAQSVVVRRMRRFFPLRDVFADLERARAALERHRTGRDRLGDSSSMRLLSDLGPGESAEGGNAPALRAEARRVWLRSVADLHTSRQLARWAGRRAAGRPRP